MRGRLLLCYFREERENCIVYWHASIFKWDAFWMTYVLYSIFDFFFLKIFRKFGLVGKKKELKELMIKYPRCWAIPFSVTKEFDENFNFERMMRERFKRRDWESFAAWKGFGIGPWTI